MNIFLIPSWYPSPDHPLSGIFIKEQVTAIAHHYPQHNIGVSLWGQKNEANLLWIYDHFKNIRKILNFRAKKTDIPLEINCWEFSSNALTWTNDVLNGNMKNIILANEENLRRFEAIHGKVSLIHAHVAFPAGYIAMQMAKKYHLPYIITEHMGPFPLTSYLKKSKILVKINESLQNAQYVISVSPHAASDIKHKTGVQPLCIPNLISENLFTPPQEPIHFPPFIFFTLGDLIPQKGIPDLLKAIALLENKDALFRIGGYGEKKKDFEQLAKELEVEDKIQWLGELTRTKAAKEFQQCHAFVLPSLHESMGIVFAEAIACGKPIIATRCGGPEFIVTPDNGVLVDVNSPQQLADVMDDMVQTYSRYNAALIRKDFMERFSSKVITKKIASVYEAVLSKKPLPANLYQNE